jgi:hypothetical protein
MEILTEETPASARHGSALEVLRVFLKLGLTCFGGPIAHIGYFRDEFVMRRKWIDEHAYADLVGLCQFLPGPASSQVGFSIGLMRAGYLGALAEKVPRSRPRVVAWTQTLEETPTTAAPHGDAARLLPVLRLAPLRPQAQLDPPRSPATLLVSATSRDHRGSLRFLHASVSERAVLSDPAAVSGHHRLLRLGPDSPCLLPRPSSSSPTARGR